jgi:transcriptional regulator with XRE-family HTH domain
MRSTTSSRRRPTELVREATRLTATLAATLGRDVRLARRRRRLTQAELAERVGVHQSWISQIELGHGRAVPLELWSALGVVLGRPIAVSLTRRLDEPRGLDDEGHLAVQEYPSARRERPAGRPGSSCRRAPRTGRCRSMSGSATRPIACSSSSRHGTRSATSGRPSERPIASSPRQPSWPRRSTTVHRTALRSSGSSAIAPAIAHCWTGIPRSSLPRSPVRHAGGPARSSTAERRHRRPVWSGSTEPPAASTIGGERGGGVEAWRTTRPSILRWCAP